MRETDATQKGCAGGGERRGPWERGRKQWGGSLGLQPGFCFFFPLRRHSPSFFSLSLPFSASKEEDDSDDDDEVEEERQGSFFPPKNQRHVPQLVRHGRHHLVAAGAAAPGARRERERREGKREAFERSQSIDDLSSSSLFLTRVFSSKKPPPIPTKNQVEYAMEAVKQGSAAVGLKVRLKRKREIPPPPSLGC